MLSSNLLLLRLQSLSLIQGIHHGYLSFITQWSIILYNVVFCKCYVILCDTLPRRIFDSRQSPLMICTHSVLFSSFTRISGKGNVDKIHMEMFLRPNHCSCFVWMSKTMASRQYTDFIPFVYYITNLSRKSSLFVTWSCLSYVTWTNWKNEQDQWKFKLNKLTSHCIYFHYLTKRP